MSDVPNPEQLYFVVEKMEKKIKALEDKIEALESLVMESIILIQSIPNMPKKQVNWAEDLYQKLKVKKIKDLKGKLKEDTIFVDISYLNSRVINRIEALEEKMKKLGTPFPIIFEDREGKEIKFTALIKNIKNGEVYEKIKVLESVLMKYLKGQLKCECLIEMEGLAEECIKQLEGK